MFQHPKPNEYGRIGELLLQVDPYIYPAMLGQCNLNTAMQHIMTLQNSPFAPEHIWVAKNKNKICAIIVAYMSSPSDICNWSHINCDELGLPVSFKHVCDNYLIPMQKELQDNSVYISCIATDTTSRKQGYATKLLNLILEQANPKPVKLDVLADNVNAIKLYKKLSFKEIERFNGYAYDIEKPKVISMIHEHM